MKKSGFTLAEILIAVGIVGVVAAIMLPMVNKFKPDENKIKYLQAYNSLMEIMPSIVNNRVAYPLMEEDAEGGYISYTDYPLMNLEPEIEIDGEKFSGVKKICRLIASGLNTTGAISCGDTFESDAVANFKPSFKTINGVEYMVQTSAKKNDDKCEYITEVYLDVNGTGNGSDCFITDEKCKGGKDVDRFKLMIGPDGTIIVADSMGEEHLLTRANWKLNRDKDIDGKMLAGAISVDLEKIKDNSDNEDSKVSETTSFYFGDDGATGSMNVYMTNITSLDDFLDLYKDFNVSEVPGPYPYKYWAGGYYYEVVNGTNSTPQSAKDINDVMNRGYEDADNYKWYKVKNDPLYDSELANSRSNYEIYRVWTGSEMKVIHCYSHN